MIQNVIMLEWKLPVYSKVLVNDCLYHIRSIFFNRIVESRERPEWLADYESELDEAIAALRSSTST